MSDRNDMEKELLKKYLFDENLPEEEVTKRQWQIIEAAIKVFSEKGFEGSRTSDIAKEAEVAEGTIFRYYKTKKDLLIGLLFPMVARFIKPLLLRSVERIANNTSKKPVDNVIEDIMMDRLELVKKNKPLIKTVAIESTYHPELLKPIQEEIGPVIIEFVDRVMKKQIESGEFRDLDVRLVSRSMMSLLMGYIILTGVLPDTFKAENDRDEIRKIVDIFLNGVKNK